MSLPWTATLAPCRANRRAMAASIPRELPVTKATLSLKRSTQILRIRSDAPHDSGTLFGLRQA